MYATRGIGVGEVVVRNEGCAHTLTTHPHLAAAGGGLAAWPCHPGTLTHVTHTAAATRSSGGGGGEGAAGSTGAATAATGIATSAVTVTSSSAAHRPLAYPLTDDVGAVCVTVCV